MSLVPNPFTGYGTPASPSRSVESGHNVSGKKNVLIKRAKKAHLFRGNDGVTKISGKKAVLTLRAKKAHLLRNEDELSTIGAGAGTSGGKRRKTRKNRKSKKSRRSTRKA
jgi:hypothetical protein